MRVWYSDLCRQSLKWSIHVIFSSISKSLQFYSEGPQSVVSHLADCETVVFTFIQYKLFKNMMMAAVWPWTIVLILWHWMSVLYPRRIRFTHNFVLLRCMVNHINNVICLGKHVSLSLLVPGLVKSSLLQTIESPYCLKSGRTTVRLAVQLICVSGMYIRTMLLCPWQSFLFAHQTCTSKSWFWYSSVVPFLCWISTVYTSKQDKWSQIGHVGMLEMKQTLGKCQIYCI